MSKTFSQGCLAIVLSGTEYDRKAMRKSYRRVLLLDFYKVKKSSLAMSSRLFYSAGRSCFVLPGAKVGGLEGSPGRYQSTVL